jgi:hypothetical protein
MRSKHVAAKFIINTKQVVVTVLLILNDIPVSQRYAYYKVNIHVENFLCIKKYTHFLFNPQRKFVPSPLARNTHVKIPSRVKALCIIQFSKTNSVASVQPEFHRHYRNTPRYKSIYTRCEAVSKAGLCLPEAQSGSPTRHWRNSANGAGNLRVQPMKVN